MNNILNPISGFTVYLALNDRLKYRLRAENNDSFIKMCCAKLKSCVDFIPCIVIGMVQTQYMTLQSVEKTYSIKYHKNIYSYNNFNQNKDYPKSDSS